MNPESLAHHRRSHLFLLAMVVLFAAGLRFFSLSTLGYWTDEFCTLSVANGWGLQLDRMMLTHYFAAGAAIGLVGYSLLSFHGRARRSVLISATIAAIAFVLLWGPHLLRQRTVM